MKKTIIMILAVMLSAALSAQGLTEEQRKHISDSLRTRLGQVSTPVDSVDILYDLLDLARYNERLGVGEQLFSASQRAGSLAVEFDAIRRLGSLYGAHRVDAEKINNLIYYTASMPLSDDQRLTLAFLRVQANVINYWNDSPSERQTKVRRMIVDNSNSQKGDPYDDVEFLFTICRYLQDDVSGKTITEYVNRLGEVLKDLPGDNLPILSQYYVQSSMIYSEAGLHEKAVDACRHLLQTIAKLDEVAKKQGHTYRNYDLNRYIAYRRLLNNYPALTEKEVDEYYERIQDLAKRNADVANDIKKYGRVEIYYLMAKKRYREALALLSAQVDDPGNKDYFYRLYPLMIEAAKAVGDNAALLKATEGYNEYLQNVIKGYSNEHQIEMSLFDEVRNISGSNNELLVKQRESAIENHRVMLRVAFWSAVVMLLVIIGMSMLYIKSRRLTARLRQSNDDLINERDEIQNAQKEIIQARDHARRADRHKTEFINNMSHEIRTPLNAIVECSHLIVDNTPEEKRHYLKRYADMIDISADMLMAIVNDVLEIAQLDNHQVAIQREPESVDKICQIAVESMRKHVHDGVVMEFVKPYDDEFNITTDARRVEQVLINLLSNGAKFTEEGYVRLTYSIDPSDKTLTFSVEDTGVGVPKGKEEVIFERFEKLSNLTSGTGLGLNISRSIASILGGSVRVDTSYEGPGARFLFTLPIE